MMVMSSAVPIPVVDTYVTWPSSLASSLQLSATWSLAQTLGGVDFVPRRADLGYRG